MESGAAVAKVRYISRTTSFTVSVVGSNRHMTGMGLSLRMFHVKHRENAMIASRRNFLAGFGSLLAAPAVVRADSLMHVRSIVKPYATVWGVGWDLEVIEHAVWTPDDALRFARFGLGRDGINKFREVTEVVYAKPPPPILRADHWAIKRVSPAKAFLDAEREKLAEWVPGNFVPTVGHKELEDNNKKQLEAMLKDTTHLGF